MKNNKISTFYFATGILIMLTLVLIFFEMYIIRKSEIDRARTLIADFITLQAENIFIQEDFSIENAPAKKDLFIELIKRIKTQGVIRVKIWDKISTIIFSDDQSIIGKSYPDNEGLRSALEGKVVAEIEGPKNAENISEKNYREFMEVYVPIFLGKPSKLSGVIEVYYGLDNVNRNIASAQIFTSIIILGSALIILIAFLSFF